MKKLNIKNKEIQLLVLFGVLTLLFVSVNFTNNYSPQGNYIFDNELPRSAAISITIVTPSTNENFSVTAPDFVVEINDTKDTLWYTIDGGAINTTFQNNGTIDQGNWTLRPDGPVTIVFYVNDSLGNIGFDSVIVNKDTVKPSIDSIDSPLTNSNHTTPPSYSLSITEANLDDIWYTLDGGSNNYTGATSGTIDSTAWSNAGQGVVTITFYANDSAGNWDSASVVINRDTVNPSIDSIDSPLSNSNHTTPPSYSLSITEANLDDIWYTLDGGSNNYTGATSGTIDSTAWSNAGQGAVTIIFYVNDSAGNLAFDQVIVNKDTVAPIINIISPQDNQTSGIATPNLIVEIDDDNLDWMWYTIDGGITNITFISNGTIDLTNWTALNNGPVTLTFYANDTLGQMNSDFVNFTKNADAPVIIIVSPTSPSDYGTPTPSFIVEITDETLDTMWYTLNANQTKHIFISNGTIDGWSYLGEGLINITFYANDSLGNIGFDSVIVNKDTIAPMVNLVSPTLLQLLGVNLPSFTVEIDDPILDTMWYSLDNGLINITFVLNGTFNQLAWNSVLNGTLTIYFYANDSAGNEASDSVVVRVDKIIPTIVINLPTNNTVVETAPWINITVNDANVHLIWYSADSYIIDLTSSNNSNQQLEPWIWNGLLEGAFTIELFANDTAGNLNNLYTINLIKDISAPLVTIVYPSANATYTTSIPEIRLTISDTTLDTAWYSIVGTNYTFEFTPDIGTTIIIVDQAAWNALSNGIVTITFFANDSLGRISYDNITLIRNVEVFDWLAFFTDPLVLTIIGVAIVIVAVSIILVKRRKFHRTSNKEVKKIESLWD